MGVDGAKDKKEVAAGKYYGGKKVQQRDRYEYDDDMFLKRAWNLGRYQKRGDENGSEEAEVIGEPYLSRSQVFSDIV